MQETIVARTPETLGQYVLQHQAQKLDPPDAALHDLLGFAVAPAVGHLSVLAANDVSLLNHPAVQIAPQIDQRLLTVTFAAWADPDDDSAIQLLHRC